MGVVVISTRPINQGEQIFISYSGDETIEDTWGEVFVAVTARNHV
jgi:hypothetical protein